MKTSKKWQLLFLVVNFCVSSACSKPESKQTKDNNPQKTEIKQLAVQNSISKVQIELNKAQKANKNSFVVVTGTGVTETEKAITIAKGANFICKNAVIVEMNRDDASNTELVSKWRLAGAPIPLILVISPKGNVVGGYPSNQATPQNIAELVPTPKMDEIYLAMNNKKPTIIVVSSKSNSDRVKALETCKSAVTQLKNNAEIVEIDFVDSKEATFIKRLNLQGGQNKTSVLVLNISGQITGLFDSKVGASELVKAATKVVKGCGTSCSPGGC